MHGSKTSHGGDPNENDNFKLRKLIIYGDKKFLVALGGDLNEHENYKNK